MKYIAITFDDGRSDNYTIAKNIMEKYNLLGTVYITTGFIDGTWEGKEVLESPTRPLSVDEILALKQAGWEIGLHGDRHQTEVSDMRNALNKLRLWGIDNSQWGVSVPNSTTNESEITSLFESEYGNQLVYIRRGRKCDTTKFFYRVLYGMYSVLGFKWAYRRFNRLNCFNSKDVDKYFVPSVVIKANDKPELVFDFICEMPDEFMAVLMLHSILPSNHPLCGKDPWSWGEKKFDSLCKYLSQNKDKIRAVTVEEMIRAQNIESENDYVLI